MKTELKHYTVEEILKVSVYNGLEGKGLFRLDGKLVIQPEVPAQLHLQRR